MRLLHEFLVPSNPHNYSRSAADIVMSAFIIHITNLLTYLCAYDNIILNTSHTCLVMHCFLQHSTRVQGSYFATKIHTVQSARKIHRTISFVGLSVLLMKLSQEEC